MQNFNNRETNIGFIILDIVQYDSIEPALKRLKKEGINFDLIIPRYKNITNDNKEYAKLFNETYLSLTNKNTFPIIDNVENKNYKIIFKPYPVDWIVDIKSQFSIRYLYGLVTKPDIAFDIKTNIGFDVIMCISPYDSSFLSPYAKTVVTGFIKYADYENSKKTHYSKKRLLYLPTYGEYSSIDYIANQLKKLADKYQITIKPHHLTNYLQSEKIQLEKLKSIGYVYDHGENIIELLDKSDVVLSDNSGAIWDAILTNTPVAIFNKNDHQEPGKYNTLHDDLISKEIIPGTSKPQNLELIIEEAMSIKYKNRQKKIKTDLFPIYGQKTLDVFMDLVLSILNDRFDMNYKKSHDHMMDIYKNNLNLKDDIDKLKENTNHLNYIYKLLVRWVKNYLKRIFQ